MKPFALLDRPIAFHRCFVDLTGSVNAALMLSQAVYWQRCNKDGVWWFQTQEKWQREIGLTRREQETARKALRALPFWREKLLGLPGKLHFFVDLECLLEKISSIQSSMADSATEECTDAPLMEEHISHSSREVSGTTEVGIKEVSEAAGAESKEALRQSQAEAIYALYPKKVNKQDGLRAIKKALKAEPLEVLVESVTAYADAIRQNIANHGKGYLQFVPNPEKWFNGAKWLDDRATWIRPPIKRTAFQINLLIKNTQDAIDSHIANAESINGIDNPTEEQKASLRELKTRLFNLREELNKTA